MKLVDDITGTVVKYNLVQIYSEGSYHCNIYGAQSVEHAQSVAEDIASNKGIPILSINEGYYRH